ncbi:hypothetical protein [methane-oxidizing endosymbiont of Gigantopelta aegis]|uniref:hypothetical protein n=1 Tax=methane-oxidizing endosymbiont of Gigantopelta aegis TaxID=2794938 RepID=UPI0018DBE741|nr:hypothetical protein [methane-oxidizing endosymbiont of Gigantopelta aegis]
MIKPKDFIETNTGLVFAVVDGEPEQGRVLCFLRYRQHGGRWQKLGTVEANRLLQQHDPETLFFSNRLQATVHAVPMSHIQAHHRPQVRLQQLLSVSAKDDVEQALQGFCTLLKQYGLDLQQVGVTGSMLIGAQNTASDIDLVFYRRSVFQHARRIVADLVQHDLCQSLNLSDWEDAWRRRGCDLTLPEYIAGERRKHNKVMFKQRKIDLSLLADDAPKPGSSWHKKGHVTVSVKVIDATYAFDYPAVYKIEHSAIMEIVCFTATYFGQAEAGEWVEVAGQLEVAETGEKRIIIGSSREATGEYMRSVHTR